MLRFFLSLILLSVGCASVDKSAYLPENTADERSVYVIGHGWHTGIVVSRKDIEDGFPPAIADNLPKGTYLEFGWGEEDFYRADKLNSGVLLKAAFMRNDAVLHVAGFSEPPESYFSNGTVVRINISEEGVRRITLFLADSFRLSEDNAVINRGKGLYGNSEFFAATGIYSLFHNCNRWTIEVLAKSGAPVSTSIVLTQGAVMKQAEKLASQKKNRK